MTCLTSEQIDLLARNAVEPGLAEEFRRHVEQCDACRRKLEECLANEQFLGQVKHWPGSDALEQPGETTAPDQTIKLPEASASVFAGPGPDSFPGYEIVREIHRGGQGVIYQAIQKTTRRKVAIKVMREGPFAGKRDKVRFEREVQVLGALKHPNIVAIHDSGMAAGSFYYVMDYISGQSLDEYMASKATPRDPSSARGDKGGWPIDNTLRLFARICEAVNAAHLRGVIHRDLKPGNIRIDARGEPHVLDFGLAKMAAGEVTEGSRPQVMTVTGQFVGSLPWASPEQAEGAPDRIDTRTDVYSLGVILYQMLTGKFPYEVVGNMRDVLENILKAAPTRPSTIRRQINDEVETIVLKCLSKESDRRYQTAGELARDVHHYLAGQPIEAKRDSTFYVLKKTLRRYKAPAAVAGSFVLVVTAALVVSLGYWRQAVVKRDQALIAEAKAQDAQSAEAQQRQIAEEARAQAENREMLARRHLYAAHMKLAQEAWEQANVRRVLELLETHRPSPDQHDLRGFEWYYLWHLCHAGQSTLYGGATAIQALAFSPTGTILATGSGEGLVRLWDTTSGQRRATLRCHNAIIYSLAFSPDGRTLATGSGDCTAKLWDLSSGQERATLRGHARYVHTVAFRPPDGEVLATGSPDGTVRLWNVATHEQQTVLRLDSCDLWRLGLAFSPDGKTLATANTHGTVTLWDPNTGTRQTTLRGHTDLVFAIAFSPDGELLATGSRDRTANLWNLTGPREPVSLVHREWVHSLAFSPDGKILATAVGDGTVRFWDANTGQSRATLKGHLSRTYAVAFSPEGDKLATGSLDCTVKLWSLKDVEGARVGCLDGGYVELSPARQSPVNSVAFTLDGGTLAAGRSDGTFTLWDPVRKQERATVQAHTGSVNQVTFSPDSTVLASASSDGTVKLWNVATTQNLATLEEEAKGQIWSVAFSCDGDMVASGANDGTVVLWDTGTGLKRGMLRGHTGRVRSLVFSPNNETLASGSVDNSVKLWNVGTLELKNTLAYARDPRLDAGIHCLALSPEGSTLAAASWDSVVTLWDLSAQQAHRKLRGSWGPVFSVAFAPDGKGLVTGGADDMVRLWDVATGQEIACLKGYKGNVHSLIFAPDGRTVATGSQDGTVRLWHASSNAEADDHPDAAYGLLHRAALLEGQGKWDEAEPLFRRALEILQSRLGYDDLCVTDVKLSLGRLLAEHGEPDSRVEAEALLEDALTAIEGSWPHVPDRWRRMALKALKSLYAPGAMNDAARFADVQSRLIEATKPDQLNEESREVLRAPDRGHDEYLLALHKAQTACRRVPDNGAYLTALGIAQYRLGEYAQALTTLRNADRLCGYRSSWAVSFMAMAHQQLSQTKEAEGNLLRAWAMLVDPGRAANEDSVAFMREAERLILGELEATRRRASFEAVRELVEARFTKLLERSKVIASLSADPEIPESRRAEALLFAEYYQHDAYILLDRAWEIVKWQGGNPEEYNKALRLGELAREIAPDYSWSHGLVGVAQYRLGAYEDALVNLTRANEMCGGALAETAYIALTQQKLGLNAKASETFQQVQRQVDAGWADTPDRQPIVREVEAAFAQRIGRSLSTREGVPTLSSRPSEPPSNQESRPSLSERLEALEMESPAGAKKAVELARSANPAPVTPEDHYARGKYLWLGGDVEEASAAIRDAVERMDYHAADYLVSLGCALGHCQRPHEAKAAFEKAISRFDQWSPQPPQDADPDHWTAAYFLDLVSQEQYTTRWRNHERYKERFACFPWFYVGQRMEIEGKRDDAVAAYRKCVELGELPDAHHMRHWAAYRLKILTDASPECPPAP